MDHNHPDRTLLRVIEAVSEELGIPMKELPPLADVINPEALETLVTSTTSKSPSDVTVTFRYAGTHVCVRSGNLVSARAISSEQGDLPDG